MSKLINCDVATAVKILTKELSMHKSFRAVYQANIAVAFQDTYAAALETNPSNKINIHKVSNEAAESFLDLWIADSQGE